MATNRLSGRRYAEKAIYQGIVEVMNASAMSVARLLPAFTVVAIVLALVQFSGFSLTLSQQMLFTLIAVVLLGMPHGALDVLMIRSLVQHTNQDSGQSLGIWQLVIYAGYLLTVIIAFISWLAAPAVCLGLFLVIAAAHFRHDWHDLGREPARLAMGTAVVTIPVVVQPEAIATVFQSLGLSPAQAQFVIIIMSIALVVALLTLAFVLWRSPPGARQLVSVFVVLLAGIALPPLLFFVAYFCALHSVIHTLVVKHSSNASWQQLMAAVLLPMAGTVLLLSLIYLFTPVDSLFERWSHVVFIGLFALTVPHILLSAIYQRYRQAVRAGAGKHA